MGRPLSFNRDEALDKAMKLFWERGYAGTSIAHLTEAMGINPPSLYAAFGNKRALFEAATDSYQQNSFTGRALDEPNLHAAITRLFHDAAIEYTTPGRPRGCMIIAEPTAAARRKQNRSALIRRIREGVAAGQLPAEADAQKLADYVLTVLGGLSARSRDGATRRELVAVADVAMAAWPRAQ